MHSVKRMLSLADIKQLQNITVWLEDQKIRHYKIEDREELRDFADQTKWLQTFSKVSSLPAILLTVACVSTLSIKHSLHARPFY